MPLLSLLKLLHALFLFFREMWLRDRTFRQFVRQNLSFILVSVGFAVMTLLFVNTYIIIKDQESQAALREQRITHLISQNDQLTEANQQLTDSRDKWQGKYLDLKDSKGIGSTPPPPKTPQDPVPSTRPPTSTLVDRWKRLNQ